MAEPNFNAHVFSILTLFFFLICNFSINFKEIHIWSLLLRNQMKTSYISTSHFDLREHTPKDASKGSTNPSARVYTTRSGGTPNAIKRREKISQRRDCRQKKYVGRSILDASPTRRWE